MLLPAVLHPDVVDFIRKATESTLNERVWNCIDKLRQQQFDGGLRVKKLKGIAKGVWEARINQASRLIFTYENSKKPETGQPQTYIAVQDICLAHDDVSQSAKARQKTPDAEWLNAELLEAIGSVDRDQLTPEEQSALEAARSQELQIPSDFVDELLGNIQWRVVESDEDWHRAIANQDADLPLKLTPDEYELVKLYGNLLLSGSAGTGKTTVGLYRLLKSVETLPEGKRLYVAYNPILVKEAEKQFKRLVSGSNIDIESVFEFKTIGNLCLDILGAAGNSYLPEDEVTYHIFEQLYRRQAQQPYPSALIWDEIRSIIKGAHLETGSNLLSEKQYAQLGKKRSSVVSRGDRHKVYKVAAWYQNLLQQEERFDEIDLARKVLQLIRQGKSNLYQLIVCDEVQDFTELHLELLVRLVASGGHLFFAGDLHQMISPSGFRWEDLKTQFFKGQRQAVQKTLDFNFRSVGSLVNLANQLLKLRYRLLQERINEIGQPVGSYGECARLIAAPLETLQPTLWQLNPNEAILVRTEADRHRLSTEFKSSFVFTIEEAKGLEFDTVFLVEFFKPRQSLWNKVLGGKQAPKETEKPELRLELNLLYVAVTRARRILNIWETQLSAVWSQSEVASFVQRIDPESAISDRIEPMTEMWRERGHYYLESGFYRQAIECFEKSGDIELELQTRATLLLQERNYGEAARVFVDLQDWQQAAQLFEKVGQWEQAADCWQKAGNAERQQVCEVQALEVAEQWENAAQRWEALGRIEDAKRCWLRSCNEEKKAEIRAVEFEQNGQWLQAAKQYELVGNSEKIEECRKRLEEKMWSQGLAKAEYELATYNKKSMRSSNLVDELNEHLCEIGVLIKGKDGEYQATKALVRNKIPGWKYDLQTKFAYLIGQENGMKFRVEFEESNAPNESIEKEILFDSLKEKAKLCLEQGNIPLFQEVRKQLKKLLPYRLESDILVNQGVRESFDNYERLISNYNQALWLNPYHSLAYYNRGVVYSRLGNYQRAVEDFTLSIDLDPGDPDAYDERSIVYRAIGEYQAAIEDVNRALTLNPTHGTAYLIRGSIYSDIGSSTRAIQDYNMAIRINSRDAEAYFNRGQEYRRIGDFNAARKDLQKAAELYQQQGSSQDYQDALNVLRQLPQ